MRTTVRPSICTGRLPSAVKIELLSTSFCTFTYSALLLGNTMLRSISEWGQMEVTTKQSVSGLTTGPPAAIEYAVEPVGVDTITPSARTSHTGRSSQWIFTSISRA